jgi:hypothetical protein
MQELSSPFAPFIFILNQLEAAGKAVTEALNPPKRPRGRPPKVEEPPLLPGAYRHVLRDDDSEDDKAILKEDKPKESAQPDVPPELISESIAVIIPYNGKYACILGGQVIGTSKHKDYWEYHYGRGDLRSEALRQVAKFIRVDTHGSIESSVCSQRLKEQAQVTGDELALAVALFNNNK